MGGLADKLLSVFYPKRCLFCGKTVGSDAVCCPACGAGLPKVDPALCTRCGKRPCICGRKPLYYDGALAAFYYVDPVKQAIHRFKFSFHPAMAAGFAEYLAEAVKTGFPNVGFDLAVSVPMRRAERRERGFDHAYLLTSALSRRLKIPATNRLLLKTRDTRPQHELPMAEREKNLRGAFDCKTPALVKGKRILLCDDVMTTAATLNECARVLKKAGAKEVFCAVVATTVLKREQEQVDRRCAAAKETGAK